MTSLNQQDVSYILGRLEALSEAHKERNTELRERLLRLEGQLTQAHADVVAQLSVTARALAVLEDRLIAMEKHIDELVALHKKNHEGEKKSRWPRIVLFGGGGSALAGLGVLIERLVK